MSDIRLVIFDFGGTLFNITMNETDTIAYERSLFMALGQFATIWPVDDADTQKRTIAALADITPEQVRVVANIAASGVLRDAAARGDYREYDPRPILAAQLNTLGLSLSPRALDAYIARENMLRYIQAYTEPSVTDTLRLLHERDYTLGVISNFCSLPDVARNSFATLELDQFFDPALVLFSCEVGWRKPAPQFFAAWLEKAGNPDPATCLFVGDRFLQDVWGAQQAGIRAVLTTQYFQDEAAQTAPDGSVITPDGIVATLAELPALLQGM